MSKPEPDLDCTKCGLCCLAGNWNDPPMPFVELTVKDAKRIAKLDRRLVVLNNRPPSGFTFQEPVELLLAVKRGRCAALEGTCGKKVACTIYEDRPQACRRFETGSAHCLSFRRSRGLT